MPLPTGPLTDEDLKQLMGRYDQLEAEKTQLEAISAMAYQLAIARDHMAMAQYHLDQSTQVYGLTVTTLGLLVSAMSPEAMEGLAQQIQAQTQTLYTPGTTSGTEGS